jgi:hypothetical protein
LTNLDQEDGKKEWGEKKVSNIMHSECMSNGMKKGTIILNPKKRKLIKIK